MDAVAVDDDAPAAFVAEPFAAATARVAPDEVALLLCCCLWLPVALLAALLVTADVADAGVDCVAHAVGPPLSIATDSGRRRDAAAVDGRCLLLLFQLAN